MVTLVTADGRTLMSPNLRPLVEQFGGQSDVEIIPHVNGRCACNLRNPGPSRGSTADDACGRHAFWS